MIIPVLSKFLSVLVASFLEQFVVSDFGEERKEVVLQSVSRNSQLSSSYALGQRLPALSRKLVA